MNLNFRDIFAKVKGSVAGSAGLKALLGGVQAQAMAAIDGALASHGVNLSPEAKATVQSVIEAAKSKIVADIHEHVAHADEHVAAINAPPAAA